jgi:deazaflavin-dependent oxidoreductase (nitroreductase family)
MSAMTPRPPGRRLQARIFRILNVPMRVLLGLPFATPLSGRLMLVHHTGRATGRHYRQPVSYVRHDGELLTPGGGNWTRNLQEAQPVRLRVQGRDLFAFPELVHDPAEVARLLGVMAEANPALQRFVRIPRGADGRPDPAGQSTALGYGFRVVRWRPETPLPA